MSQLFISFIAGILTVLAPCVFSLLPVIIGGSSQSNNKYRPLIITASLAGSIMIFTVLLKVSTLFINLDPRVLTTISGGIILFFGLISLFPRIWDAISLRLNLSRNADNLMERASIKEGYSGAILLGASLGPVFSSCSPTYALIVATILPIDLFQGLLNIFIYTLGLSLIMLIVAYFGQSIVRKMRFATNPYGWFKRGLGILFIILGIAVMTGLDKSAQVYIANNLGYDSGNIEQSLLGTKASDNKELFNVPARPAPELVGIETWLNGDSQSIADLKGKVVLIDFWTYSCINCQRSLPYVTRWYDTYKDNGFVVLGIHAPEFAFEKNPTNVKRAIEKENIRYPVGLDNDFMTWNAYDNIAWPAHYLIDKDGMIRRIHYGEGEYTQMETAIVELLNETGQSVSSQNVSDTTSNSTQATISQTAETYLGYSRQDLFLNRSQLQRNQAYNKPQMYDYNQDPIKDSWYLNGDWTIEADRIISNSDTSTLTLNYNAREVYLVMGSPTPANVQVDTTYPGQKVINKQIKVDTYDLYTIVEAPQFETNGSLTLTVPNGVILHVFTFGS